MPTRSGARATDRPERYAKQLLSHWSERGPVSEEDDALAVEISAPDGGDTDGFADVVARHLKLFGPRGELSVTWAE